jgi:spore germination cell wall hydrolase CwlJ-like protein
MQMVKNKDITPLKEAPMITIPNVPPNVTHVQNVSTFAGYYNSEAMRQAETVVACLVLEAGGEGKIGIEAVNEVIHNRAHKLNKSLYDVVTARKQFSCFNSGIASAVAKAKKHPMWKTAIEILQAPVTNHTHGATQYHTIHIHPYWEQDFLDKGYKTVVIKHHKFYYR